MILTQKENAVKNTIIILVSLNVVTLIYPLPAMRMLGEISRQCKLNAVVLSYIICTVISLKLFYYRCLVHYLLFLY